MLCKKKRTSCVAQSIGNGFLGYRHSLAATAVHLREAGYIDATAIVNLPGHWLTHVPRIGRDAAERIWTFATRKGRHSVSVRLNPAVAIRIFA